MVAAAAGSSARIGRAAVGTEGTNKRNKDKTAREAFQFRRERLKSKKKNLPLTANTAKKERTL